MTLRTALVIDGDSAQGQRALREFEAAIESAEGATAEFGREGVKASVGLERLRVAQEQAAAAGVKLTSEQRRAAMFGRELVVHQAAAAQQMQRVTASAGAQRAGMQQLSFQIGDVATMFAMGARPMQIFASQGTQVIQALGMMGGGARGVLGILGGPWGIALTAAATVAMSLGSSLLSAKDDAESFTDALRDMESDADRAAAALGRLRALQKTTIAGDITLNQIQLNKVRDELSALDLAEQGRRYGEFRDERHFKADPRNVAVNEKAQQLRWDIVELEGKIAVGNQALKEQAEKEREAAAAAGANARAVSAATGAIRTRTGSITEEERARQQANKETERYIGALEEEIAKIGLDASGLRQLEAARQRDAAQTEAQKQKIDDLNASRERAMSLEEARKRAGEIGKENEGLGGEIAATEREAQAIGMVGWERERLMLQLEREAQIRPLLTQLANAEAAGQEDIAEGLRKQIDLLNAKFGLQIQLGNTSEVYRREQEALERLREEHRQLGQAAYGALSDIVFRGEDAIDTMSRLASSIADAALEALLLGTGPLGGSLGGIFGGSGGLLGSLFGSIFGGGRASGGPVMPGKMYAVNETSTAPGLFMPLMPGRIEPASNDNQGRASGAAVIRLELSGDIDARIQRVSGPVAVEVYRAAAPEMIQVASAETVRQLMRPRM